MKILVTGSHGLVGSALLPALTAEGHHVVRLVRTAAASVDEIAWNPEVNQMDSAALEDFDAVVHLAGENIAGRWTAAKKARIRESRVAGTRLLCEALAKLQRPPRVLIAASAIGFYGNRGDETLTEESAAGVGFLPEVVRNWEAAAQPAHARNIRVVQLRFGIILSADGGALSKMLPPFRLGLGGRVGSGRQWWSWISMDDVAGAICFAIASETLSGPVNVVAPNPATNAEFTRVLGRVLHRPTVFPLPAFVARLALGQMAEELLLASTRVEPARLLAAGFQFKQPTLEAALRHVLPAGAPRI